MSEPRSLVGFPCRQRALVSDVRGDSGRIDKLAALGILPGIEIVLLQTKPVYVIECGETTLALEQELAENVYVSEI